MKNFILVTIGLLCGMTTFAQTTSDEILGRWTTPDQTQILEFVKNGDTYEAVVREAEQAEAIGKKPVHSLVYKGESTYEDGTIFIPKRKKTADCQIELISDTELELKVTVGWTSKTVVWTRV